MTFRMVVSSTNEQNNLLNDNKERNMIDISDPNIASTTWSDDLTLYERQSGYDFIQIEENDMLNQLVRQRGFNLPFDNAIQNQRMKGIYRSSIYHLASLKN